MAALIALFLFLGFLVVLPLIVVGLIIRLVVGVALIPLKIAGFAVKLSLGLTLGLIAVALAAVVILLPLLPILGLAFVVWMIVRLLRRQPAVALKG